MHQPGGFGEFGLSGLRPSLQTYYENKYALESKAATDAKANRRRLVQGGRSLATGRNSLVQNLLNLGNNNRYHNDRVDDTLEGRRQFNRVVIPQVSMERLHGLSRDPGIAPALMDHSMAGAVYDAGDEDEGQRTPGFRLMAHVPHRPTWPGGGGGRNEKVASQDVKSHTYWLQMADLSGFRQVELAGHMAFPMPALPHPQIQQPLVQLNGPNTYEVFWVYRGVSRIRNYGNNWLTLYFSISDLRLNLDNISSLCMKLASMARYIVNNLGIHRDAACLVNIEYDTDPNDPGHLYFQLNRFEALHVPYVLQLRQIINFPWLVFDQFAAFLNSNAFTQCNMRRVYFSILSDYIGGNDKFPPEIRRLRNKYEATIPNYHMLRYTDDGSCGLHSLLWSMLAACRAVTNFHKKKPGGENIDIYKEGVRLENRCHKKNYITFPTTSVPWMAFLCQSIGWKSGNMLSYQDIAMALSKFNEEYKTNFGLIILNGQQRHKLPYRFASTSIGDIDIANSGLSFTRIHTQSFPMDLLFCVLVHYSWPGGGHYDWLGRASIVSFIHGAPSKNLKYDFFNLKMVDHRYQPKYGPECKWCGSPLATVDGDFHNGNQKMNHVECDICGVKFVSDECYKLHKVTNRKGDLSACEKTFLCPKCSSVHDRKRDCTTRYCFSCTKRYPVKEKDTHICYIYEIGAGKKKVCNMVMYADIESERFIDNVVASDTDEIVIKQEVQRAIMISVIFTLPCKYHALGRKKKKRYCCENCENSVLKGKDIKCDNCSELCTCERKVRVFENKQPGDNALKEYMDWALDLYPGSTHVYHNGSGFDFQLLMDMFCSTSDYKYSYIPRGNRILCMTVHPYHATESLVTGKRKASAGIRFIDSFNFIPKSLRKLAEMFNLECRKGYFPFEILNELDWEKKWEGKIPNELYFGLTKQELEAEENDLNLNCRMYRKEVRDFIADLKTKESEYSPRKELINYNIQDVVVLQQAGDLFRYNFQQMVGVDPFKFITTPSAVAASYRQFPYMKQDSIQSFPVHSRQWQRLAVRGGKTEPFKLYYSCNENEEIKVVDINSSYPYQQAYKYYPFGSVDIDYQAGGTSSLQQTCKEVYKITGKNLMDILNDPSGGSGVGIIECDLECAYHYIPILPQKRKIHKTDKTIFGCFNTHWIGFLTVLAEAIKAKQVIILGVTRLQLWVKPSNTLFRLFMLKLYATKVQNSGWKSILKEIKEGKDDEEKKKIFVEECAKRHLQINPDKVVDNKGSKEVAKLINNCGWGYMTQRPHSDEVFFVDTEDKEALQSMGDFLVSMGSSDNPTRLIGKPLQVGKYQKIHTTLLNPLFEEEKDKNKNVAYHVGGQVPAYGLQQLSASLLSLDRSQPLYCDTDSIFYVVDTKNKKHQEIICGPYLGDFSDEYPDYRIVEYVCLGPKSYCLRMVHKQTGKEEYKTKFKGLPLGRQNNSLLDQEDKLASVGLLEMKSVLQDALLRLKQKDGEDGGVDENELVIRFHYMNFFKRTQEFKVVTQEEKKSMRFTFDKRRVKIPQDFESLENCHFIDTEPLSDDEIYSTQEVEKWWQKEKESFQMYINV